MNINYTDIGVRVRKIRIEKGITQRKLADMIEMTTTHISHIENGTTKLGLPTIVDIANALDTTVDNLLCGSIKNSGGEYLGDLSEIISGCTPTEIRYAAEITKAALEALHRTKDPNTDSIKER